MGWNFGNGMLGRRHTEETKRKIGLSNKTALLWCNQDYRERMSEAHRGKPQSLESRIKKSASQKGERGSNWRGGITPANDLIRKSTAYQKWRRAVFTRDDYTCQACGERGGRLHADHELPFAIFPDLRLEILNGRTLCISCHKRTASYGRKGVDEFLSLVK